MPSRDRDRADVGLDVGYQLLDAAFFHRIEHEAAGRATLGLNLGHELAQPGLVAAAREAGVVALAGKALGDVATDAGTSAEDQADGFVHVLVPCWDGLPLCTNRYRMQAWPAPLNSIDPKP